MQKGADGQSAAIRINLIGRESPESHGRIVATRKPRVMTDPAHPQFEPLHPARLTWTVLLGRWVQFARSAVAWPTDGEGGRYRASVPDIIQLQAICFALQHLDDLPAPEQALGLDRATVLVQRHAEAIRRRWADGPLPSGLLELIDDAERALEARGGDASP
jgi:hypothetical protein